MRMKIHALFLDLPKPSQRKYLEPAGIREDRLIPHHELVKPSQSLHHFITGTDMQMVSIRKLHLRSDLLQVCCGYRSFDSRCSSYIHKYRGLNDPMYRMQPSPLGKAVSFH